MKNNHGYSEKNVNSLLKRTEKWLKVKLFEVFRLAIALMKFGPFSILIRIRVLQLLVYGFIYPLIRVTLGRDRASKICEFFITTPSMMLFPFPRPLKSKLLIKDNKDWSVVTEMFINDVYQKDTAKNGMNVVDIGAHIGGHTVFFAERTGSTGKVIAIEPDPKNYKDLTENIALNGFTNTALIQTALSDHTGSEKLYTSPWSTGHSLLPELAQNNNALSFIEVSTTTLDELLEKLQVKKIDIIKIDAEGAELPILQGAKMTLKNNPHAKIFVASYHYPGEIQAVTDFLENHGFKTKVSPFDIVITQ